MHDYCVIGGGIVGVATAAELLRRTPDASLLLLEKQDQLGVHQTGHNSGVVHSGIYYAPGSLKARLCREGVAATSELAQEHRIPIARPGKLLVATNPAEHSRMLDLAERARTHSVPIEQIDATELRRREPHVTGLGAIVVPSTAIIDYRVVTTALAADARALGADIRPGVTVTGIAESTDHVTVRSPHESWTARTLIACAGLQSDRIARLAGLRPATRIIPFRGEYFQLPADRTGLVRHLVYPIPDPALPFLGVHLSPTINGNLSVGPNAVLGLSREGYRKGSVRLRDVADYLRFPGFYRMAAGNARTGARELRNSLLRRGYLAQCRKYCPELQLSDLLPRQAGIRAQAVARDGTLLHDFLIERTDRGLHVLNAPSPAATAAIPIARTIADTVLRG